MRGIIGGLALTVAVLLNVIELTSQSKTPMGPPPDVPPAPTQRRVELPPPFYYRKNGEVGAKGHPNVYPIIHGDFLCGASDGTNFFPIIDYGRFYVINLKTHAYVHVRAYHLDEIQNNPDKFIRKILQRHPSAGSSSSGGHQ